MDEPPPPDAPQCQCHLASNFEIAPGLPPPPRVNAGTIILGLSNFCEAASTIDAPCSFHRRPCAGRSLAIFLGELTLSPQMCIHCRRNACGGCGCSVAEASLCVMSLFALLFLSICPRFQIATHLLPLLSDCHISKWGLSMVWPVGHWWWQCLEQGEGGGGFIWIWEVSIFDVGVLLFIRMTGASKLHCRRSFCRWCSIVVPLFASCMCRRGDIVDYASTNDSEQHPVPGCVAAASASGRKMMLAKS